MKKSFNSKIKTLLSWALVIGILAVLVGLVTYTPAADEEPVETTIVEQHTVTDTVQLDGLVTAAIIDDAEQDVVSVFVDENDVNAFAVDDAVDVAIAAVFDDEETVDGVVYSVSDEPRITGDVTEYEVIVRFGDDMSDEMREDVRRGMHAEVTKTLETVEDVIAVPVNAVYEEDDVYYVTRVAEKRQKMRKKPRHMMPSA